MDDETKSKQELINELIVLRQKVAAYEEIKEELHASEELYRNVFTTSPLGFVVWDREYRVLEWNEQSEKMFGWTREEAVGANFYDLIVSVEAKHIVESILKDLLDGRIERHIVHENITKDGKRILCEWNNSVLRDHDGNMIGAISLALDVTERKRSEEALRDREEELVAIYENAPLIMLLVDKEWRIKKTNAFTTQLTGRSVGDMIDLRCGEALCCIHALDTQEGCGFGPACKDCTLRLAAIDTIETGQSHPGVEMSMRLSDGGKERDVFFLVSTRELVTKGNPMALVSIQDITIRKKMENALRESEDKYRSLAATADSMYLVDMDGRYLFMNEGHAKRFSLITDRIIGRTFGDFHSEKATKEFMDKVEKVFITGSSVQHEYQSERDGRYFLRTFSPVKDQDEWATISVSIVSKDITGRKRMEEMLESSREQLRALAGRLQSAREEERKQIAREIHDDLGSAMTGLKIDLSHITAGLLEIENDAKRESCLHEAKEMAKLIDLMIHTVRRIMMELRPSILDDFGLVAAIEWHLQDFQKRTGIQCEFISALEEIDLSEEYSTAIYRIVQESLTNVARHANATRVTVTFGEKSGNVMLEVRDNGIGIRKEQVAGSKSLGLSGMKERALLIGGTVDISGSPGKGTTVLV